MRQSRIYTIETLSDGGSVSLDGDTSHYVTRVLRLKPGDKLSLFNGADGEWLAVLASDNKKQATAKILQKIENVNDSPLQINLGLGLSRGERMDYAIQKATELGVTKITPLVTERCEVKLDKSRAEKRLQHWSKVVINASEQCGRASVPEVSPPQALNSWLQFTRRQAMHHQQTLSLVFDHSGSKEFTTFDKPTVVNLLIGSEGGLSAQEIQLATSAGFEISKLGPRVLRTETAPIAALTLLQYLWGDF